MSPRNRLAQTIALLVCVGCAKPAPSTSPVPVAAATPAPAPVAAEGSTATQSLDHTLPSGTTLSLAVGWTVTEAADGATLRGPSGELSLEVVEVHGADSLQGAIDQALAARVPDMARPSRPSEDQPGRDGWEARRDVGYVTSPEESREVGTTCFRQGDLFVVVHGDHPADAAERRASELSLVPSSLRPPGHVEETYADRTPRAIDAAFVDEVRASMRQLMHDAEIPGAALALFDADTVYLEEGFGVRKLGEDAPVTADTRFLIASNTKPLTTLLLAKLVDEGRLAYDTPVTDIDPDFRLGDAATTARVQVQHLICACTGMPRQDWAWVFRWQSLAEDQAYADLAGMQPTTAFGQLYQYSNYLAGGAGYVAAHALYPELPKGEAYDRAMQERVFGPLGMTHSTFDADTALEAGAAWPHSWSAEQVNVPGSFDLNRCIGPLRPAGGLWSTVGDYRKYLQMELREGVLADGSTYIAAEPLLARREPQVRVADDDYYGMGLSISTAKGIARYRHGGIMLGYRSQFLLDPNAGVGAVVFTNADTGELGAAILTRIGEMLYDDDTPEALQGIEALVAQQRTVAAEEVARWTLPADPAAVERLADAYLSEGLGGLQVRREGDAVTFVFDSWSSPMATRAEPDGSVSFVTAEPSLAGLELNAAGEGPIDTLTLRESQHVYTYRRVDGTAR